MPARVCVRHKMLDGTIMDGPTHALGHECVEWSRDGYKKGGRLAKNPLFKGRKSSKKHAKDYSAGGKYARGGRMSSGGMLVGPSHDDGGIQAIVDGTEPIEVEGGEFVINKKTVDAVGEDFLHKLNHTSTPYHDPATGYQEGQLPVPSQYAGGGITRPKPTKKFRAGGRIANTKQKFKSGGNTRTQHTHEHTHPHRGHGPGTLPQGETDCSGTLGGDWYINQCGTCSSSPNDGLPCNNGCSPYICDDAAADNVNDCDNPCTYGRGKLQRGGNLKRNTALPPKYKRGVGFKSTPSRRIPKPNRKFETGGTTISCGGPNQAACGRKFQVGGGVNSQGVSSNLANRASIRSAKRGTGIMGHQTSQGGLGSGQRKDCRMHDGNVTSCKAIRCVYDHSKDQCQ